MIKFLLTVGGLMVATYCCFRWQVGIFPSMIATWAVGFVFGWWNKKK